MKGNYPGGQNVEWYIRSPTPCRRRRGLGNKSMTHLTACSETWKEQMTSKPGWGPVGGCFRRSMEHERVYSPRTCLTEPSVMEDIRDRQVGRVRTLGALSVSWAGLGHAAHVASSFNTFVHYSGSWTTDIQKQKPTPRPPVRHGPPRYHLVTTTRGAMLCCHRKSMHSLLSEQLCTFIPLRSMEGFLHPPLLLSGNA